ncbi:unnamed protein product [Thlaspi arvense]|uniref:NYN domain-containing protein n=1 Tax=Thlaspi arvense TaxID=13288 RepID=A0AAU9SA33_THLAR|nr:unnamed protein product [Thlaspi arvense]
MMHNKEEKLLVLWDINGCPIPDGFDPRLVGPRIESALKKSGYSGPLTITAIGDLRRTPITPSDKVLRVLSSTGIALRHGYDILPTLLEWNDHNPCATIMIIAAHHLLQSIAGTLSCIERTCKLLQRDPSLWKSSLLGVPEVCRYAAQSFDDLTTHLKSVGHADEETSLKYKRMMDNKVTHKENKTFVFWHINYCPIPDGYTPRMVRRRTESAVKNSGFSGSVTITELAT